MKIAAHFIHRAFEVIDQVCANLANSFDMTAGVFENGGSKPAIE